MITRTLSFFPLLALCISSFTIGQEKSAQATSPSSITGFPVATLLNINKISAWYNSNGEQERSPFTLNSGVTYPRGTSQVIYASGLMWGAMVHDDLHPTLRVNGYMYSYGTTRGAILGIRTGSYEDPSSPDVRIWRVRRDYATADLNQDAAEYFGKSISRIDTTDISLLRAQYEKDWIEWPARKGAPFYDADHDGIYSPKLKMENGIEVPVLFPDADEPGLQDADQVIWYVCHDLRGPSPWTSPPIGLEQQATIWGYNRTDGLGSVIFKKFKLIYKGTKSTPTNAYLDSMYVAHFSDADLGDVGDDFAGCDTVLNLAFVYNEKTGDRSYMPFGISVPSAGYIVLQGPFVKGLNSDSAIVDFDYRPGYKNLPMTSFECQYSAELGPPYEMPQKYYQILKGLPPFPTWPSEPPPLRNPSTGALTRYWLSGDPIRGTGWLDSVRSGPFESNDVRLWPSSGPFSMAVGDTQEVVYALVAGLGSDRLASVSVMKYNARLARETFLYGMVNWTPTPIEPKYEAPLPANFALEQNYPNPFNPSTRIRYSLPYASQVSITVVDLFSREVKVLARGTFTAGNYEATWDGTNGSGIRVSSGVYFYTLRAKTAEVSLFEQTRRMILVK